MLNWDKAAAVYVFTRPIDMRVGCDRLAGIVRDELEESPYSGSLYVFVSRNRRRVKILFWERDGFWLLYRRLEVDKILVELRDGCEQVTGVELRSLLAGTDLARIKFCRDVEKGVYS